MVELPVSVNDVPVAFVKANCGNTLTDVVVEVKKSARTSPETSSFESDVVAVAPINTWLVVVEMRTPELLKNVQLTSLPVPPSSVPQRKFPDVSALRSQLAAFNVEPGPPPLPLTRNNAEPSAS